MKKIALIGCGGSGKTYVSTQLASLIGAPVTHLDAVYYDHEWNALPQVKFAAIQEELTAAPTWIIEGNYAGTLPIRLARADTVIFLDLPARTCLRGIAQRRLRHGCGQHGATGVYDRVTWSFISYVWGYLRMGLSHVDGPTGPFPDQRARPRRDGPRRHQPQAGPRTPGPAPGRAARVTMARPGQGSDRHPSQALTSEYIPK